MMHGLITYCTTFEHAPVTHLNNLWDHNDTQFLLRIVLVLGNCSWKKCLTSKKITVQFDSNHVCDSGNVVETINDDVSICLAGSLTRNEKILSSLASGIAVLPIKDSFRIAYVTRRSSKAIYF